MPVHLFGNPAPVEELTGLGVPVLEDAAQAIGARRGGRRIGWLGHAATFSFFPSKNLGCLGDGGAIVTDDDDVAERARRLRFHGSTDKVTYTEVGYNSRLDELQAAVLRVLLPELDGWNDARRAAARAYEEAGIREYAEPQAIDAGRRGRSTTCTSCARTTPTRSRSGWPTRASARAATTARPCTCSRRWQDSAASGSNCPGRWSSHARTWLCRWAPSSTREQVEAVVAACASGST